MPSRVGGCDTYLLKPLQYETAKTVSFRVACLSLGDRARLGARLVEQVKVIL